MKNELICLFNGNKHRPPCFTPLRVEENQTTVTCPSCGTRHVYEGGKWMRVKEAHTDVCGQDVSEASKP